ncbi:MAG: extracellular solute-binding protein [Caldilineaceae bacterium]|nr:extracellular solute-binding protein [Caldilineaceae bacterium]
MMMNHAGRSHPVALASWLLVVALLLVACSGGNYTAPAPEAVATTAAPAAETSAAITVSPAAAGTIRVAVVRGAMSETMRALAEKFMEANPGVTVTVEEEPEGGAFDALIAAGNQPDLIVVSFGSLIGRLAASGAALPLEDLAGFPELLERIDPATVEQLYGHHYYVPIGADVTAMIYNKQLFEEAGLDPEAPPTTWDEFLAAAEQISSLPNRSNGNQVYGTVFWNDALSWGGWYWNMLQPIYLNANQNQCLLLNRLGTDIVFDAPECQLAAFFDFNQKAQQFAPPTMEQSFFSRSIGMWPQYGYSWEPNLQSAAETPMVVGEDVGIAPVPVPNAGDTAYTTYGGRGLMILRTNPDREQQTWSFVQFLMEDENNLVFLQQLGYLPTLTNLKTDPYFQAPARLPFVQMLETAVLPQQFDAADRVANQLLGVYQQTAVEDRLTPEQAVETAAQQARDTLAAP